jgi:hypothetical protein
MWALLVTALLLQTVDAPPGTGAGEAAAPAGPDAPTVTATLDKSEVNVGDRVTLTITAIARPGITVTLPQKPDLGKLEVLDRDDGDKNGRDLGDGRRAFQFTLGVAAYEPGELEVPPIEVGWVGQNGEIQTATTAEVPLKVAALVPPEGEKQELQPIRPPRSALVEDKRVKKVLAWTGVGLCALALVWLLLRLFGRLRRRRVEAREEAALVPSRPPDEVAMEKLRALRAQGDFAADLYRPFYFAVAEVVREYLGARYGFDSLELTTSELIDALGDKAPHLAAADGDVVRFLVETDLVKFAKAGSTDEDARAALDQAEAIVLSTTRALEEAVRARAAAQDEEKAGG